jgi:hypothetical protein
MVLKAEVMEEEEEFKKCLKKNSAHAQQNNFFLNGTPHFLVQI